MRKSDCRPGMDVMVCVPGGNVLPARVRVCAPEDVHLEWRQEALDRNGGRPLPSLVGYNDIRPVDESDVLPDWLKSFSLPKRPADADADGDGRAPTASERPASFPVDLEEKPRQPYEKPRQRYEEVIQAKTEYVPSDEIRDKESWPLQWQNFQRIVRERRRLLRVMRANMQANYLFTSVVDAVETTHVQDGLRIALASNHQDLTRLKLNILTLLDEHYDHDPGFRTGYERSQGVDEGPPAEST